MKHRLLGILVLVAAAALGGCTPSGPGGQPSDDGQASAPPASAPPASAPDDYDY